MNRQVKTCHTFACAIDCKMSMWSKYSARTKTCGTGRKTKTRSIVTEDTHGGVVCPISSVTLNCNTFACPIDCKVSGWKNWTPCTKTCGTGTHTTTRSVIADVAHGGVVCPNLSKIGNCMTYACPIDCKLSGWSGYGACSKLSLIHI